MRPCVSMRKPQSMIRAYRGVCPRSPLLAYIDPSAQVIGDVEVGERSSVWCNVTIRGDVNYIRIGEDRNRSGQLRDPRCERRAFIRTISSGIA